MKLTFFLLLLSSYLCQAQKVELYFDFSSDVPTGESLATFADWAKAEPNAEVVAVTGFTDSIDTGIYNIRLAERRIGSVLNLIKEHNIPISEDVAINPVGENFKQNPDPGKNRKVVVEYATETRPDIFSGRKLLPEVKNRFASARRGDLIRIHNIHFELNSETLTAESMPVLEDLRQTLIDHPKIKIEIHGHICCNRNVNDTKLSYRRAMVIFNYLRNNGIPLNRLGYKGFGSARPIFKIPEEGDFEAGMNRRVEILITAS